MLAFTMTWTDNCIMLGIIEYLLTLKPEVWAIYIVGFIGFGITIRQLRVNFRLKKKADTFENLSEKIQRASELSRETSNKAENITNALANAADSMVFDATGKDPKEFGAEVNRRMGILEELKTNYNEHSEHINSNTRDILKIIKVIEKSTVVKEKTRRTARYLFYETSEQYELMKSANSILATIQVVPLIGEKPNVQPDTFRAIRELVLLISQNNNTISGYLNDLEIILHNDLVKKIYGRAKNETIPVRHLSHKGITDSRTKQPLL